MYIYNIQLVIGYDFEKGSVGIIQTSAMYRSSMRIHEAFSKVRFKNLRFMMKLGKHRSEKSNAVESRRTYSLFVYGIAGNLEFQPVFFLKDDVRA